MGSEKSWILLPQVLWGWPARVLLTPEPLSGLGFSYLKRHSCVPVSGLEVLEWSSRADFLLQPGWMWLYTRGGSGQTQQGPPRPVSMSLVKI